MRRILLLGLGLTGAGAFAVACGSSSDSVCEFSGTCFSAAPFDGGVDGDATVGPDSPIGDDGGSDSPDDAPDVYIPPDAGPCGLTSAPHDGGYAGGGTGLLAR